MEIEQAFARLPPGWVGHSFETVGSTQDEARAAVQRGTPTKSIFVADEQTAGRGRQGRVWVAPSGRALLMSIVWREAVLTPAPWRFTALASTALVEAIERVVPGLKPAIKWPNDVMVGDLKVAGVLAESSWDGEQLVMIVGVGVNVSASPPDVPTATDLARASGQPVDRGLLLVEFVRGLEQGSSLAPAALLRDWQARMWGRGQRLRFVDVGGDVDEEVVVLGAELDGSLRVRRADGTERVTTTGELIL